VCAAYRQERTDHVLWWATCPEDQYELEMYADKGVLVATGSYETATDGERYPVYREKRPLFDAILEDLEAEGFVMRTGETRPGRDGRMQPVYRAIPYTPKGSESKR